MDVLKVNALMSRLRRGETGADINREALTTISALLEDQRRVAGYIQRAQQIANRDDLWKSQNNALGAVIDGYEQLKRSAGGGRSQ